MTTLTAVSASEIVVRNNGRIVRIPVANLIDVDAQVACTARRALTQQGTPFEVPGAQPRGCRPKNYATYGGIQL